MGWGNVGRYGGRWPWGRYYPSGSGPIVDCGAPHAAPCPSMPMVHAHPHPSIPFPPLIPSLRCECVSFLSDNENHSHPALRMDRPGHQAAGRGVLGGSFTVGPSQRAFFGFFRLVSVHLGAHFPIFRIPGSSQIPSRLGPKIFSKRKFHFFLLEVNGERGK